MHDTNLQATLTVAGARSIRIAWWLAAVAMTLRTYHFFCNPPVWCDELWVLRNITGKTFVELLGPLAGAQAAPPFFLWLERAIWMLFGNDIYALRMPPLLASCGTILLLFWVGRRTLRPGALPWAVLLLGCSDPILDYTCEVKPYVVDALLTMATMTFLIRTETWPVHRRAVLFALLTPVIIFLSYPGCFVCGGFLAALLPDVWACRKNWRSWASWSLAAGACVASFLALLLGPIRAQRTQVLADYWVETYPRLDNPLRTLFSFSEAYLELFEHYWRPTGGALLLPLLIGAICHVRRRNWQRLAMLVVPCLLAMLASLARSYPFHSRLALFCIPLFCLIVAEGIADVLSRIRTELSSPAATHVGRARLGALAAALVIVVLLPLRHTAYWLSVPRERLTHEIWPEPVASSDSPLPALTSR